MLKHSVINKIVHSQQLELPLIDLDHLAEAIEGFCLTHLRNPRTREMEKLIEESKRVDI